MCLTGYGCTKCTSIEGNLKGHSEMRADDVSCDRAWLQLRAPSSPGRIGKWQWFPFLISGPTNLNPQPQSDRQSGLLGTAASVTATCGTVRTMEPVEGNLANQRRTKSNTETWVLLPFPLILTCPSSADRAVQGSNAGRRCGNAPRPKGNHHARVDSGAEHHDSTV